MTPIVNVNQTASGDTVKIFDRVPSPEEIAEYEARQRTETENWQAERDAQGKAKIAAYETLTEIVLSKDVPIGDRINAARILLSPSCGL